LSNNGFISSSVKVLSILLKVKEYAILFFPTSTPAPTYTSNTSIVRKFDPHVLLIVFSRLAVSIFSSTTNAMSFFTLGNLEISLYFGLPVFISNN